MKRKSGQHRADKRKQARAEEPSGPIIRDGAEFTHLELPPTQSVTFTGSASLEVTCGCLEVYGACVTPETGPIPLHAPSKFGRALQLTAAAATADAEPPCQPPEGPPVLAVLQPLGGGNQQEYHQQQQQQSYSVTAAAGGGGEPPTWQVPAAWGQAVADLVAQAAAAAAAPNASSSSSSRGCAPLSVAVCGSKGAGKSSFARLLVNSLLGQGGCQVVAFLDCDPGQPEFTPPGLLSLQLLHRPVFGPSHLQQQTPLLAFFQGDTSSQSEPGWYLQAVHALVQRYSCLTTADVAAGGAAGTAGTAAAAGSGGGCEVLQVLPPLVINTPGWITGLGLDLLGEVLRCAAPTHVVQLQTGNPKKNLPAAAWWLDSLPTAAAAAGGVLPVLLQVPAMLGAAAVEGSGGAVASGPADSVMSGPSGDTTQTGAAAAGGGSRGGSSAKGVSAAAARSLMWLAWAERIAAANPPAAASTAAAAAGAGGAKPGAGDMSHAAAAAAAEDFGGVAAALAAAAPMAVALSDLQVEVLHAQVCAAELPVALNGAVVGLAASSGSSSQQGFAAAAAAGGGGLHECLGLGLVRAVDGPRQQLYLLTDLPEQQLQRVDLLQLGKLELPDRLLEGRSFAAPYQGLFCLSSTATGAGQIKSRNNLLRSSQLLMR